MLNNIKKFAMALGALAIASGTYISVRAHQVSEEKSTEKVVLADQDWHFNGALNPLNNNPQDSSQYSKFATESCDDITQTVCMLTAPADPSNSSIPDLNYVVPGTGGKTVKILISEALTSENTNQAVKAFRSE
ncbi:hypothetical protein [Sphingobacterium tabacisoli]|uniref:Uncharacterized protein n=1 Tax=Sphingobacterium tabacisoli TaxID=2044855 RepID=A0ABW5L1V0_9SPHI|nr:hypothetical protein [Sphingobacterium tabacisoli]